MLFSKLKISTKLIISSAVFLIPIGIMLFFICSINFGIIRENTDDRDGINSLKPAVTIMQNLPRYLNVYLGLEQGDLRNIDEQITSAVRIVDREMQRYKMAGKEMPDILVDWETIKKLDKKDPELYQKFLDFEYELKDLINWIGERSGLILVSDMNTYYLAASALSNIPEALIRFINVGNKLRADLYDAENLVALYNASIAATEAQGRRSMWRPFEGNPRDINFTVVSMVSFTNPEAVFGDSQLIWNNRVLFESDADRINISIRSAIDGDKRKTTDAYDDLEERLDRYRRSNDELSEQ